MKRRILLKVFLGLVGLILIFILGVMAFMNLSPQFGASPSGADLERISKSSNYDGNTFVNLIPTVMDMTFSSGMETMYQFMFASNNRSPKDPLPVDQDISGSIQPDSLAQIIWFGHSAILLEIDGKRILIDPMLGKASSPVSFASRRFAYEIPIDIEAITDIDAVVLSHDHYDHLDYPSILKLKDRVNHFFTPLGVGSHLRSWGVEASKITELDWWQSAKFGGLEVTATPARHFSGRGFSDRNKTQWASWIVRGAREKIYFSGDSGYGPHFKEIGDRFGPFDFAMMECGQYNERWEAIHMMPEQTVQASIDVQAKRMMPIHWSAFNLALHSWTDPVERASKAATTNGVDMLTPMIGQRFTPAKDDDFTDWWRQVK